MSRLLVGVDRHRLLHHGCLLTVGGDSSSPVRRECRSAAFDRTDPATRRSAWRVEILTEARLAERLPGALTWISRSRRRHSGPARSLEREAVVLVEIAAVVFGEGAQASEIVELDATLPEGHEATLAQLAQDAVHVDGGEPQRIGQKMLVERAGEAALPDPSPTGCRRRPSSSKDARCGPGRCAGRC